MVFIFVLVFICVLQYNRRPAYSNWIVLHVVGKRGGDEGHGHGITIQNLGRDRNNYCKHRPWLKMMMHDFCEFCYYTD